MKSTAFFYTMALMIMYGMQGSLCGKVAVPSPFYNATLYYSDEKRHPYDGRDPLYRQRLKGLYSFKAGQKYDSQWQWYRDTYMCLQNSSFDAAQREEKYREDLDQRGKNIVKELSDDEQVQEYSEKTTDQTVASITEKSMAAPPVKAESESSFLPMFFFLVAVLSIGLGVLVNRKRVYK